MFLINMYRSGVVPPFLVSYFPNLKVIMRLACLWINAVDNTFFGDLADSIIFDFIIIECCPIWQEKVAEMNNSFPGTDFSLSFFAFREPSKNKAVWTDFVFITTPVRVPLICRSFPFELKTAGSLSF